MIYINLGLIASVAFFSSIGSFADDHKDFNKAMTAGSLIVTSKITFPAGQSELYFQDGEIKNRVNRLRPHCILNSRLISDKTTYYVKRGHKINFSEETGYDFYNNYEFLDTSDIFIRKVYCQIGDARYKTLYNNVTLGEAKRAFGNYVSLTPGNTRVVDPYASAGAVPPKSSGLKGR